MKGAVFIESTAKELNHSFAPRYRNPSESDVN